MIELVAMLWCWMTRLPPAGGCLNCQRIFWSRRCWYRHECPGSLTKIMSVPPDADEPYAFLTPEQITAFKRDDEGKN